MAKKYLIFMVVVLLLALGTASVTLASDREPNDPAVKEPNDPAVSDAGLVPVDAAPEAVWPGPDGYGYVGSTPNYSWVEISGTGTEVLLTDDDWDGPFPIGFTFNFYGTPWTDFYVSSNGFLSFGAGSTSLSNQCPLPSSTTPNNIIPLYWDDLDPGDTNDPLYYQSFAAGECPYPGYAGACLVVQYEDFCHYPGGASCSIAGTWEGILFDDHSVVVQFEDAGAEEGSGSTTGIENDNAPGDYGLTFACNAAASVVDGTTARFAVEPFLALLPESTETIGCADQDQVHTFTLLNFTGADGTFDLAYSVPSMNGFMSGPADIFVANGTSADFEATLTPNCVPADTHILAQVDVSGNGFADTATIDKIIVDAGLGFWEGLNPINGLGRSRPAGAAANGKIYVMGGEISGGRANTVEEFDPATGLWTTKAGLMPTPASNVCAAAIGNDIYVPGGYDASANYLNTLQVYHVDTDTWETIDTDPLPEAKAGPGCAALDGKLYAYGGVTTGGGYTSTAYVYDPAAPAGARWTALSNMTYTRGYLAGAAVNGKVYSVGGRDGATADFAYVEAYDPADGLWHPLTNMNFGRGGPGAYAWGNNLVVCAGGWTTYRNTCEWYDTTQGYGGAWTSIAQTMINGRRTFAYATLPDALYAVAGYNGTFLTAAERIPTFECPDCGAEAPDLSESYKLAPASVDEGQPIHYTIVISNTGNADALEAMMVDVVPAGTTFDGGLTCSSGTCYFDAGTVYWQGVVGMGGMSLASKVPSLGEPVKSEPPPGIDTSSAFTSPPAMEKPAPTGEGQIESLSGSFVVFDPNAGGDGCYVPGEAQTFCFTAESFTNDWEYVYDLWQAFPADWTVNDVYVQGTPVCDSGTWGTLSWSYESGPNEVDIYHPRYQATTDHCVATYCFEVTSGTGNPDALASWFWDGDGYGNPPHWPCSSDGYAPPGWTCDESVNPPAAVPACTLDPIMLTPETQQAEGCSDAPQDHTVTVWNNAGYDTTVNLTYSIISGSGTCSGPDSIAVPDGTNMPVNVSLVPSGAPGSTVTCEIYAEDAANPANFDTAWVEKLLVSGYFDPAGWQPEDITGALSTQWAAGTVGTNPSAAGDVGYYLGGLAPSSILRPDLQMYDPGTATWTQLTDMVNPRFSPVVGWIDGMLYAAGGYDAGFIATDDLQVYDPTTNAWDNTTYPNMPALRGGGAGGVGTCSSGAGTCLFHVGGGTDSSFANTTLDTWEYDPVAMAWTQLDYKPAGSSPDGHILGAGVGCGGFVYVGGDYRGFHEFFRLDATQPAGSQWTQLANIPPLAGAMTPALVCKEDWNSILIIGGDPDGFWGNYNNTVYVYDIASDTWEGPLDQTLNVAQLGSVALHMDSKAWTFGGTIGSGPIEPVPHESLLQVSCGGGPFYENPVLVEFNVMPDTCDVTIFNEAEITDPMIPAPVFVNASTDVACIQADPDIVVDPLSLAATLPPDATVTLPLNISNVGDAPLHWSIASWFDGFDSYAAGSQVHGQGGWKGWFNDPNAGALVSDLYSHSSPNSVEIAGASDLVHEYAGYTSGTWTYTAWQYIPTGFTGQTYFIMLNTYNDSGVGLNWSVQVNFTGGTVTNDGASGGSLPWILDEWVEIRLVIDLDNDTQAFYYGGDLLYAGTWTDEVSGDGALNIGAVDLFANGAAEVYYDDISLAGELPGWLSVSPSSGVVDPGLSTVVDVTFDSTGLTPDVYTAELDVSSNDPDEPLITVPVELTVITNPDIVVDPLTLEAVLPADYSVIEPLTISNVGDSPLEWMIYEAGWYDNFDSYAPGSQMHGQGGWKGWFNDPNAGALVSDLYSRSPTNSVEIVGASDLVHEYAGYTTGTWTYTAWQYIPNDYTGQSYFIMLNQYDDAGVTNNWSTQVYFDAAADQVVNTGASGGVLPLISGQWVELRVVIDLEHDVQTFYYDGQLLYEGTWTDEVSGDGILNIGAVDLYANSASPVYYDDISLMGGGPEEIPWLSVTPDSGMIDPGLFTLVDAEFDSTGMAPGEYTAELYVVSNDPLEPVIPVPVTMTVVWPDIELVKTVGTEAGVCAETDAIEVVAGTEVFYCYTVENVGEVPLMFHTLNDSALGVLFTDLPYDLEVGASYSYIHEAVPITESVVNTGTWYAYMELDGYYVSAVDQATVAVLTEADLSVSKSGPEMVYVGEDITYELTVANGGPADATGVTLVDTLPEGVTFVSASAGCAEAGGVVTCDIGDLAAGASVDITIVVTAPAEPAMLTNMAEVSGDQPDSLVDNNTDSFDTEVAEVPVEYPEFYLPIIFKP